MGARATRLRGSRHAAPTMPINLQHQHHPMHTPLSNDDLDRLARGRAGAKLGWYTHAVVYLVVNLFLFAMSEYALGQRRWSIYPMLGWGLGLVLHGVAVFMLGAGSGLRERMIEKERERLRRERGHD